MDRAHANAHLPGDGPVGCARRAEPLNLDAIDMDSPPPKPDAARPSCSQPGACALANYRSLELAEGTEQRVKQFSRGRCEVQPFGERNQFAVPELEIFEQLNQMRQTAAQAIQTPDKDDFKLAVRRVRQHLVQGRTRILSA